MFYRLNMMQLKAILLIAVKSTCFSVWELLMSLRRLKNYGNDVWHFFTA